MSRLPLDIPPLHPGIPFILNAQDLTLPPSVSDTGSVKLEYDGPEAALMGRVFGAAKESTFGFYSTLDSQTFGGYSELYWTTQGDYDSFLTITNFDNQQDTVTVELTHNAGSAVLPPFILEPYQSVTVNVREWQQRGVLPAAANVGGFQISGHSRTKSRLQVKEHVVSVQAQTSAPFYGPPLMVVDFYLVPNPITLTFPGNWDLSGYVVWTNSAEDPANVDPNGSSDTDIVTTDSFGVVAVGPGVAWAGAVSEDTYPAYPSGFLQPFQASTQVTIKGWVKITSVTASIGTIYTNNPGPNCTVVTAQIEVQRGKLSEQPTAGIGFAKSFSTPANIVLDIQTGYQEPTFSASGSVQTNVCNGGNNQAGTYTVSSGILGVAPSDKFTILMPGDSTELITVGTH